MNLKLTGKSEETIVDFFKEFLNFFCLNITHDEIVANQIERTLTDMIMRFVIQINVSPGFFPTIGYNGLRVGDVALCCPA